MKEGSTPIDDLADRKPIDFLRRFVGIFEKKGWLNQGIRIMRRDRSYRIYCSESNFLAYRINDNFGLSWGFPGWFVCVVTEDRIVEASSMCAFPSDEPSSQDWLCCLADGDFEIIKGAVI